ncbi:NAD-dependent epimerase/dehydratase family protein [bacterium]|nr:NAD-dependent epimerase/dehydratase family protein [bacterium]MCI0612161.1 NAD-dependent epimerase/dehydratase family protein [bacterium]
MFTILGAGGVIGDELVKELTRKGTRIRLVARKPRQSSSQQEVVSADITNSDQTIQAVAGSEIVFLLIGLKYDIKVWQAMWPSIMANTIEACKRAKAKLIFFDNVYMYGKVNGVMTEETPFHPVSKKGEIRAQIATTLLNEMKARNITAAIARAADFYGPDGRNSVLNILVVDKLSKGQKASWLVNDSVKHSYSFVPDSGKALAVMADSEKTWNQTWHVPTAPNPPTGKEFIQMIADEFRVEPKYRVLNKTMVKLAGLFDSNIRELHEMLYQYQSDYIFDSTKFEKAFNFQPTPYAEGIRITAEAYKGKQ